MKKVLFGTLSLVLASTYFAGAQTTKILTPLPSFGNHSDGSMRSTDGISYLTVGSFQRGLAGNPATGNLVFIDRQTGAASNTNITGSIYILDGSTGSSITTLNTNFM